MSKPNTHTLEVWLDADLGPACLVGMLAHDRGQVRFHYDRAWLANPRAFALDPDLSLDASAFFPKPDQGNFGIFLDSSPDRWGQTLMKRREALQAKDEKRVARRLYLWDFLIGVRDVTRQGALRFRVAGTPTFLDNDPLAAPPVTTLPELNAVAYALSNRRIDNLDALRRWLAVLVASGASLGGARPKANFTEADGSLWIAKFPAKAVRLNSEFHTFCTQRFDRANGRRRFYASAMTLLKKEQSEGTSYLELAQFIRTQGAAEHADADLAQLFRRVVFNVAVGNRDDHLRNHGFIVHPSGWRLAPAQETDKNRHTPIHNVCSRL